MKDLRETNIAISPDFTLPAEGRIRVSEFLKVLPFGKGTLYNRIKAGMAPPGRLDVNIRSWDVREVRAYLAEGYNGHPVKLDPEGRYQRNPRGRYAKRREVAA